ncbi:hypothetical protein GCM10009808_09460 [Microbacterium sediminicola]|uniref:DUF4190 domain-containing protein n=1 Tax=Microbacterium sediminicola TaxID=415210 RepID=A0ABP4TX50_9MICO
MTAYASPAPTPPEPGKALGIVALVAVFFFSVVGLILGIVAQSMSKKNGVTNTPAKIAVILGVIFLAIQVAVLIFVVPFLQFAFVS